MSTLTKRVLTALVLVGIVAAVLTQLPPRGAFVFFSVVLLWGGWEWSGFFTPPSLPGRLLFVVLLASGAAAVLLTAESTDVRYLLYLAVVWWLGIALWLAKPEKSISDGFAGLAGLCCLLPAWAALFLLFGVERSAWLLVWLVGIVAAADIGAYFTGRAIGRRKLAPRLSPGKTVEGALGGVVCATAVAGGGAAALGLDPVLGAALGPPVAAVSVVGDLTVSAFKRNAGLKDTGWVLPGHGGVMDRIDSLIAAAPVFVAALVLAEQLV